MMVLQAAAAGAREGRNGRGGAKAVLLCRVAGRPWAPSLGRPAPGRTWPARSPGGKSLTLVPPAAISPHLAPWSLARLHLRRWRRPKAPGNRGVSGNLDQPPPRGSCWSASHKVAGKSGNMAQDAARCQGPNDGFLVTM